MAMSQEAGILLALKFCSQIYGQLLIVINRKHSEGELEIND